MRADDRFDHAVIGALRRITRAIDAQSRELYERSGLTVTQLVALRELRQLARPPVGSLARAVGVSHPTMTAVLERLERRGLVARLRDPADRRRVVAVLTDEGQAVLARAPSPLQERFLVRLGELADWERTHTLATLQRVAAMMEPPPSPMATALVPGSGDAAAGMPRRTS